ncbi:MAG: DoxX family protein [Candidatus Calescibacterium sp.]|nr:DoxX family protein [Candidatus Calescibacterium sp.]MCX7733821.1 DoxX family protein [bacterium]MDW8086973.1 DoxX family protein [Candidatus Calescibacterium sp.]
MEAIKNIGFLVGRIIVGVYYSMAGIEHFTGLQGMAQYAASKGVPLPELAVLFTGVLLLVGGLSVLTGLFPIVGIGSLVVFFLPVTIIMHDFWNIQDPQMKMIQTIQFMKNMGLMGSAMIFLAIPEPWKFSLSKKK